MGENAPSERVFMSSLPAGLDDARFKEIFGAYGTIKEVKLLQNNAAIVCFASVDEAKWVVDNLDGNMPEGITSPIKVVFANPQRPAWNAGAAAPGGAAAGGWVPNRPSPYGGKACEKGSGKGGAISLLKNSLMNMGTLPGGRNSKERTDAQQVYIRGLPQDTTDGDLHDIFGPFGAIPPRGVKAMLTPEGQCTGIGFVDFVDEACAAKACQALNGSMLSDGTSLQVHVKNSTKGKGKGK
uniref:RRM domain-containing protein n=1 Tax=Alexandrium monilatum TaxID=311494 RepID=A0A7S4R455_9DINO|mmetsp:Transcript_33442/g.104250  ORF Transcript_33442/g.104250 Transcript_33442/m.104250 type:complete len:239 (+) Transcript_33442:68-784(+)|eukprot:CAMPEP_0175284300 /NCGR_PEP_ID=MMETSP0093-20121207/52603_1 /TAXON_ID=311494 /ORGANISM="Alexandrium monilatum, Strain CCMP3105" /LENGTH=238 /DNA_ID=CAMNT_0016579583 /DNA_START=65 /DNA_END=781 /DNA_ORIENTATION=-